MKLLKGNDSVHGVIVDFLEQTRRSLRYEAHQINVRMDAGFYSNKLIDHLGAEGYYYVVCGHGGTFFWEHLKTISEKVWHKYREGRQCGQIWWNIVLSSKKKRLRKFVFLDFYFQRGNVENYIKELKQGIGMTKVPCKRFNANAAWLQIMQLAYNCHRWIQLLGFQREKEKLSIKTMRMRFFNTTASFIRPQGRSTIVWSQNQPYLDALLEGLDNLRLAA
ncbi:MAG: transposase [Pseudomonadota bacterium]